ncbi:MAG: energy transducer TonB [Thermosynechococcaceae cyanobacterium MS004]|nr:energy transducer TonB [Thermosynechococcaceae cyanobacterium MS004]
MQPSGSESLIKALQTPTILAMLGSAGFHIILVAASALNPAESQPNRLQILSIAPNPATQGLPTAPGANNNLSVPSDLPPINLGNVPQLGALPDPSTFALPSSSQSFFAGTSPGSINLDGIRTLDVPQRSFDPAQFGGGSNFSNGTAPFPLQPPNTAQLPSIAGGNFQASGSGTDPSQLSADGTAPVGPIAPAPLSNQDLIALYAGEPNSAGSNAAGPNTADPNSPVSLASPNAVTPEVPPSETISPEVRGRVKVAHSANEKLLGQNMPIQRGPRLAASYPAAACDSKQEGSAEVYGVFGPDGSNKIAEVVAGAPSLSLNQAARAAVKAHSVAAAGANQAIIFTVDIPYSAAVCGEQSEPSSDKTPQAPSGSSASPKPSATPSGTPSTPPERPSSRQPASSPTTTPKPPSTETNSPSSSPSVSPSEGSSGAPSSTPLQSPVPEPSASNSPEPEPSTPPEAPKASDTPEPQPSPSAAVPQDNPSP